MIFRRFRMSRKDRFENEEQFEQADFNYYYFPPMFRDADEDDDMRADNKKMPVGGMMSNMMPDMDAAMMPGMQIGMEPGMGTGMDSATLPGLGINPATSQQQPGVFDPGFMQSYLRQNIGKRVRIEFLVGTQILTDRSGTLAEVGISYVVLRDPAGTRIVCDLYSIKFVTIFD